MTILARLERWKDEGAISPEQYAYLAGICRGETISVFLELNILLYAGVLAFVAGLGWTVTTWSKQLGDVVILAVLSAILATCAWYCFSRAPRWSTTETPTPTGDLRLRALPGHPGVGGGTRLPREPISRALRAMGFIPAGDRRLFFFLAYRFDNRFVLSLALSSLAGWFGLTISHWPCIRMRPIASTPFSIAWRSAWGAAAPAAWPKAAFLRHVSEYRGQRSLLGGALRRLRAGRALAWVLALLLACVASLAMGTETPAVCLRCVRRGLWLRGLQLDTHSRHQ